MSAQLSLLGDAVQREADVDGPYRYWLSRTWGPGPRWLFCLANSSWADATKDDPTVRRLIGFARREKAGGFYLVNPFALRSEDPARLLTHADPIGPENDRTICEHAAMAVASGGLIVAGWGIVAPPKLRPRNHVVLGMLSECGDVYRIGPATQDGEPKHPLYLRGDLPIELHARRVGA